LEKLQNEINAICLMLQSGLGASKFPSDIRSATDCLRIVHVLETWAIDYARVMFLQRDCTEEAGHAT
jgi:hypothetical protein